jgi:hypothetical protein
MLLAFSDRLRSALFHCAAGLLLCVPCAAAQEQTAPWTHNILIENDSFYGHSDRHYTNGLYWSQTAAANDDYAAIADAVMLGSRSDHSSYRHGYFFGQSMFAPQDLSAVHPDPTDRPYAGWLYGGFRLYREDDDVLDRAEVTIGVVGPLSAAENVQKFWHALHLFGGKHPRGWGSQLGNEPGLVLTEQRIWRKGFDLGGLEFQALPEVTASVGNVFTYAGIGGMLRLGQNLKTDWGPARIQPALSGADFVNTSQDFTWYLFAGGEERLMLRNIFLDGSSFQSSPSVQARQYVGDLTGGVALLYQGFRLSLNYTQRTHEFATQRGNDEFLSIDISGHF